MPIEVGIESARARHAARHMVTASPPGRSEASSTITVNPPYSPLASAALTAPAPQEHATGTETAIISVPSPSPAAIETAARPNS